MCGGSGSGLSKKSGGDPNPGIVGNNWADSLVCCLESNAGGLFNLLTDGGTQAYGRYTGTKCGAIYGFDTPAGAGTLLVTPIAQVTGVTVPAANDDLIDCLDGLFDCNCCNTCCCGSSW